MKFIRPRPFDVTLACVFYMLNLFDMCATLSLLDRGYEELNPIMQSLINANPLLFVMFKVFGVGSMTVLLLFVPFSRRVNVVLLFMTGVYFMLGTLHVALFLR